MLFTSDTVFLHERQRKPQAGEGGGSLARTLRCLGEQDGGLRPARGLGRVLSFFALRRTGGSGEVFGGRAAARVDSE